MRLCLASLSLPFAPPSLFFLVCTTSAGRVGRSDDTHLVGNYISVGQLCIPDEDINRNWSEDVEMETHYMRSTERGSRHSFTTSTVCTACAHTCNTTYWGQLPEALVHRPAPIFLLGPNRGQNPHEARCTHLRACMHMPLPRRVAAVP